MTAPRTMYRAAAPAPPPSRSDRLRELARRVERLGVAGRTDPERAPPAKLTVAAQMRVLARELDTAGGVP